MRYIKIKLVLLFMVTFMVSCNDEYLQRIPLDQITNETFWNSENDLAVYNNSIYNLARNDDNVPILMGHYDGFNSNFASMWYLDELSDNATGNQARHNFFMQMRAGKHNVPVNPDLFGYKGWNFVRAINVGMANYGKAKVTEAVRNKYIGEARLFRGWFYADKVSKYGDVPYIEKELNTESEELFAARMPREEAMEKVLADLTFAAANLPANWGDGGAPGRLNRWAALLVKARVCLFEGTWRKYHGGSNPEKWLQEAAAASKELMDNGPYKLYNTGKPSSDYNSYLRILDVTGNPEVMYWRKYKLGVFTNHVQSYFQYNGGATRDFVEDYLCTDGLPITLSPLYKGDDTIESTFENRDPRMHQSVLEPKQAAFYKYYNADGRDYPRLNGMNGGLRSNTGYHIIKNYNADDMIGKAFNTAESPAIILRFAEALLIYAEAQAELGKITQADLDISINKLRARVAMPALMLDKVPVDPRYAADGVSPIIAEIRRERRIELFNEGFRYDDLRRWKQGKKLVKKSLGLAMDASQKARYAGFNVKLYKDPTNGKEYLEPYAGTDYEVPVFDESKHYLWPIPLNPLAQNPAIGQNPGWN
ncbi:Starch-binding associating with outer membrane [Spirosomataceae bacterium TFI 002]|nr:Starch-binding associating with outer membrane [Spirosomataceae bacterium TFI 002]